STPARVNLRMRMSRSPAPSLRLRAIGGAVVKDNRPGAVLGQLSFDLPHQLFSLPSLASSDCRSNSFSSSVVEPEVFETSVVIDAADHQSQPLHLRLPASGTAGVEQDRARIVLR